MSAADLPKAGTFILLRVDNAQSATVILDALHAQGVDAPVVGAYDTAFGVQGAQGNSMKGILRLTQLREDFCLLTRNDTEVVAELSAANVGVVLLNSWAPQSN